MNTVFKDKYRTTSLPPFNIFTRLQKLSKSFYLIINLSYVFKKEVYFEHARSFPLFFKTKKNKYTRLCSLISAVIKFAQASWVE